MRTCVYAVICALACCSVAWAEDAGPAPGDEVAPPSGRRTKFGPRDVEVRLQDGSLIRGELLGLEAMVLKTTYGTLTFPVARMFTINRGKRLPPEEVKDIVAAIKNLDNDGFSIRAAAQQKLEGAGPAAMQPLLDARSSATTEARGRIDTLLKKIAASNRPVPQTADVVKAEDFGAQGQLQLDAVTVKGKLGELKIKMEDVEFIRWLARGGVKALEIEANAGLREWVDTGVDAVAGDRMAVLCSGSVVLFGNGNSGPTGNPNWNRGRSTFSVGALIGKLGSNGTPFLIGASKQWAPDSGERLYLRLHCPDDMLRNQDGNNTSGEFSVRVASGAWIDELEAAAKQQ